MIVAIITKLLEEYVTIHGNIFKEICFFQFIFISNCNECPLLLRKIHFLHHKIQKELMHYDYKNYTFIDPSKEWNKNLIIRILHRSKW